MKYWMVLFRKFVTKTLFVSMEPRRKRMSSCILLRLLSFSWKLVMAILGASPKRTEF